MTRGGGAAWGLPLDIFIDKSGRDTCTCSRRWEDECADFTCTCSWNQLPSHQSMWGHLLLTFVVLVLPLLLIYFFHSRMDNKKAASSSTSRSSTQQQADGPGICKILKIIQSFHNNNTLYISDTSDTVDAAPRKKQKVRNDRIIELISHLGN